jgi:thioredoxin 1
MHTHEHTYGQYSYDVDEADFEEKVVARSHEHPVLLDIGAEWCGPCKVLTPRLEKLAHEYGGKFLLARVDADENMRIAGRHRVRGFPTVIAYSRGQETDRFHSAQPDGYLRRFIDKLIAHHQAPAGQAATPTE